MHPTAFEVDLPFLGVRAVSWYGLLTFAGVLASLVVARRWPGSGCSALVRPPMR